MKWTKQLCHYYYLYFPILIVHDSKQLRANMTLLVNTKSFLQNYLSITYENLTRTVQLFNFSGHQFKYFLIIMNKLRYLG